MKPERIAELREAASDNGMVGFSNFAMNECLDEILRQEQAFDVARKIVNDSHEAQRRMEMLSHSLLAALKQALAIRDGTGRQIGDVIADYSAGGNPDAQRFEDMMNAIKVNE